MAIPESIHLPQRGGFILPFLLSLILAPSLQAAFNLVEDFESYAAGELTGQGPWLGEKGYLSVAEESGNKAGRFNAPNTSGNFQLAYRNLGLPTPENTTTTLFFRMRLPAYTKTAATTAVDIVALRNANLNGGGGFSDNRHQMSFEQSDGSTTANPALQYRDGSVNTLGTAINTDQWYNVWIVMTRGTGTSGSWDLYMNQGSDGWQAGDFAVTGIAFRNSASVTDNVDLALFNPANNTVPTGAQVDDFHYDASSLNLGNPLLPPFDFSAFMQIFYPGITDPAIVGQDADPDMDGRTNGWEYRFGTPPDDPSNPGAPAMVIRDGIAIVTFQNLRNVSTSNYTGEWAEEFGEDTWQELEATPVVTGPALLLPGQYERTEIYVALP